ncbi:hypothetical protein BMW26_01040 [Microbacterium sp. 1.5R]|nr:hypothetical protein BMW26_01040 [Microbacterium sp. 1.5R]
MHQRDTVGVRAEMGQVAHANLYLVRGVEYGGLVAASFEARSSFGQRGMKVSMQAHRDLFVRCHGG